MAYDHGLIPVTMFTTGGLPHLKSTATTAVTRCRWVAGSDVTVKAWSVTPLVTKAGAVAISLRYTATAGASSATAGQISKITLAATGLRGEPYVRKGLNSTVTAGGEIVAQVTTAATGMYVGITVYVTPRPFDWANKTYSHLVTT